MKVKTFVHGYVKCPKQDIDGRFVIKSEVEMSAEEFLATLPVHERIFTNIFDKMCAFAERLRKVTFSTGS